MVEKTGSGAQQLIVAPDLRDDDVTSAGRREESC